MPGQCNLVETSSYLSVNLFSVFFHEIQFTTKENSPNIVFFFNREFHFEIQREKENVLQQPDPSFIFIQK